MVAARGGGDSSPTTSSCTLPHTGAIDTLLLTVVTEAQDTSYRDLLASIMHGASHSPSRDEIVAHKSTAARLRSLQHPIGTAWLTTPPSSPATRMDDKTYLAACWHQFGVGLPKARPIQDHVRYSIKIQATSQT